MASHFAIKNAFKYKNCAHFVEDNSFFFFEYSSSLYEGNTLYPFRGTTFTVKRDLTVRGMVGSS